VRAFRTLLNPPNLKPGAAKPLEPVRNLLHALYQDNVVSDSVLVAVMNQLYVGDQTSLVSMNKAFIGLALAREATAKEVELAGGGSGHSAQHNAAPLDDEAKDSIQVDAELELLVKSRVAEDPLVDPEELRDSVQTLVPYLLGFYEGSYTNATLRRISLWIHDGEDRLRSIRKVGRSPFFYLHNLYTTTREDTIDADGKVFKDNVADPVEDVDTGFFSGLFSWAGGGGGNAEEEGEDNDLRGKGKVTPWYHGFSTAWKSAKKTVGFEVTETTSSDFTSSEEENVALTKNAKGKAAKDVKGKAPAKKQNKVSSDESS
jgi:hypothetical protein